MKRFFNFSTKGFTLIELLIVITIIGVLSTIILSSISSSRAKAYDSKVKQQLNSFRTAAEIYFLNQIPNNYNNTGNAINSCDIGIFADETSVNGSPGIYIKSENLPYNTSKFCGSNVSGSSYAVKASLYSGSGYWCVDSKGASRLISTGGSATFCP